MEKQQKYTYDRQNIIDEISATINNFEYTLLPENLQMAYVDIKYGSDIKEAREKSKDGKKQHVYGNIQNRYKSYFEANGCRFENFDFSIEDAEIECINPDKKYEASSEEKEKVDYYKYIVALAKTEAFESYCENFYKKRIEAIQAGETIDFKEINALSILQRIANCEIESVKDELGEEETKHIMKAQLTLIAEEIISGKVPKIVYDLSDDYIAVLEGLVSEMALAVPDEESKKIYQIINR